MIFLFKFIQFLFVDQPASQPASKPACQPASLARPGLLGRAGPGGLAAKSERAQLSLSLQTREL